MKIYLDTADIKEIRQAKAWGYCDGVTTNPTLIAKTGRPFRSTVVEICKEVNPGWVSIETVSLDTEGMLREGRAAAKWAPNAVIKIPMTDAGMRAVQVLSRERIKTNVTLVFSASQAILAAKAGATILSPFVGRLDDISEDGMALVEDILQIYRNYGYKTMVLVASTRHPMHVVRAAKMGAPAVTMPFSVLKLMFGHPLTDKGIERFLKDWEKVPQRDFFSSKR